MWWQEKRMQCAEEVSINNTISWPSYKFSVSRQNWVIKTVFFSSKFKLMKSVLLRMMLLM